MALSGASWTRGRRTKIRGSSGSDSGIMSVNHEGYPGFLHHQFLTQFHWFLSCTDLDSLEFPLEPNFTHGALFFKTNLYSFVNSFFSDNK